MGVPCRQVGRVRRARSAAGWSSSQQAIVDRLFVYGSLRTGQAARSLIADHVIGSHPATLRGSLYALADGYPGYVPGQVGQVVGEVMVLSGLAAAFALLDAYEGEDFVRALEQATLTGDGSRVWAWCYVLATPDLVDGAPLIEGGDWARYLSGG
jgi:gamma-glutamylcyclotransferase (GGCT)/AIG2-like uncharacterized protein YtfP